MDNLLLEKVEYKIEETRFGVWRSYLYPTGAYFAEFRSHWMLVGLPFLHYTRGICPETGRRMVAKGVIAVGRVAAGILAIGQASFGVFAIGQLALSLLFGLGQASTGVIAVGQLAVGLKFGLGQLAIGLTAIGQFGVGRFVLAQMGFGEHVWTPRRADLEAMEYFKCLLQGVIEWWHQWQ